MNSDDKNVAGSSGGAWDTDTHKEFYPVSFNQGMARHIVSSYAPKSVLEFGSGLGYLSKYINDHTRPEQYLCIEPNDLDGNYNQDTGPVLLSLDIFNEIHPHTINKKFDLVLSIEVAEHIEINRHDYLFDFLVAHCSKWIVFSGARPGQGGIGHVAERDESEWRSEFTSRGMIYEPGLTQVIRTASDEKNINHRKNVMVFRRPEISQRLDRIESMSTPYFQDLLELARPMNFLIGNLCYVDFRDAENGMPCESLRHKRENFSQLVAGRQSGLLVGLNAGHSAVLALTSNPEIHITAIDICELGYTEPCARYLETTFPGRFRFLKGNSIDVLKTLPQESFDFVHLDAGKEKTIQTDLDLLRHLVVDNHVLLIDDLQNESLANFVDQKESDGDLDSSHFSQYNLLNQGKKWRHRAYRFSQAAYPTTSILDALGKIYDNNEFPSLYTTRNDQGDVIGMKRADSLVSILDDVSKQQTPGVFVECGVAAGHSAVIAGLTLELLKNSSVGLYLYDTFAGFSFEFPEEKDWNGVSISEYDLDKYSSDHTTADAVKARLTQAGIPLERVTIVEGMVEQTIPESLPEAIAVLRLDMDLYQPTLHALKHLYPRLSLGGYLIIDDYGHWQGCKQAVDEYFSANGMEPGELLMVDYTCHVYRKRSHVSDGVSEQD